MNQKLQIFLSCLQRFKKDKIHLLHNFGYFDYKYVVQESLENDLQGLAVNGKGFPYNKLIMQICHIIYCPSL